MYLELMTVSIHWVAVIKDNEWVLVLSSIQQGEISTVFNESKTRLGLKISKIYSRP